MANPDVLSTRIEGGVAVVTLGSEKRIFFDPEMSDALFEALMALAKDDKVRAVIVTGGAPGYFVRHYSVAALIATGERLKGTEWQENAPYQAGSFDKAMTLVESMDKPVIAAISGSAMGGGFEFTLACDIRIAQEGDFQIGLPEINVGILPGGGGTQRLPRTIGTPNALLHILMGVTLSPTEAAAKGFVQECVKGKALDRAMEIAKRIATHTPESVRYIKRLVRSAVATPLDQGLALERNLFMRLCIGEPAIERMKAYEAQRITAPSATLQ
ncbi:MAG: enoyl-CoA hydratase/isomerase family protein [Alphaproteobacteria bacterium]|nr:enoyl-CoA hydratase/isomerase family protein [Alphaproteobacteria bacterium]MBV9418955.1 enoyl-CoA hydratase/isomerase family protein [Alphaproteobacteria bacterium]MBV9541126.1 enoyl-CoA hydratase/isomerase family protein [Alphaproteobacteria bacterium]